MTDPAAPEAQPRQSRVALILIATAIGVFLLAGYCTARAVPGIMGIGGNTTKVTHDLVVDRMQTVAKLVSSETTVRDVVIYQNTRLGSTKRTLVVVTGRLLAGINLDANPSVRIDSRSKSIAIELPPAELLGVEVLDLKTYDERAGFWNPFTPADRDSIQKQVRAQLIRAGQDTEILEHANKSAKEMLRTLLAQDGYRVEVTIRGQPKPQGADR
jgi:uncharacterized protein DUF4230